MVAKNGSNLDTKLVGGCQSFFCVVCNSIKDCYYILIHSLYLTSYKVFIENRKEKVSNDLIHWIDKGYKVITLTASCGLMLKFEWPLLLPNDEKVKKLSQNVMDIDEYVVDIANNEGLADGLQEIDGGVTVHHACHARAQNMGIKARDMLKLIPNIKMRLQQSLYRLAGSPALHELRRIL